MGAGAGTPDLTRAPLDRKFINVSNVCWPHPRQHFSTEPEIAYEEAEKGGAWRGRDAKASKWGIGNTKKTTKLTRTCGARDGGVEGAGEGCIGGIELAAYLRTRRQRANHANGRTPSAFFFFFFFFYLHHVLLFTFLHHRQEEIMNFVAAFVVCLLLCTFHLILSPFLRRV